MRRTAAETRAHVLDVARDLFYWNGIRATGVDEVAAKAGVAPTTLYRLFASKDELVGAYVERVDQDFRELAAEAAAVAGPHPQDQILAIFDTIYAQFETGESRGCPESITLAEFPDPGLPAHRNAVAGKAWIRQHLGELTSQLGTGDPAELADRLMLVLEGLLSAGQALGPGGPAKQARRLAEAVLASAAERSSRPADQEL
jgi:AcrR family transcriptional regulator